MTLHVNVANKILQLHNRKPMLESYNLRCKNDSYFVTMSLCP